MSAARARLVPQIPGAKKIQSRAKAELANDKVPGCAPPVGQSGSGEKDMAGFRNTVLGIEIDVVIAHGGGGAVTPGKIRNGKGPTRGHGRARPAHAVMVRKLLWLDGPANGRRVLAPPQREARC